MDVKTVSKKIRFEVKKSFVKLVNSFRQSQYMYILYHSHLIILSRRQSYLFSLQISIIYLSLSDVAFPVWYSDIYDSAYIDNIFSFWI